MENVLEKVDELISNATDYEGPGKVVWLSSMREKLKKEAEKAINIKTGIRSLDELVSGVEPGEMVVVGGKRKNGKTLLCQTLTKNFKDQGVSSLWFSYEVPLRQFASQVDDDLDFCVPESLVKNTLTWVTEKIIEAKIKYKCRVIFIDHLHYLIDMSRLRNPSLEIGAIVRTLKRVAITLDVVIFLISHVRGVDPKVEVTEDHIRDSAMTAAEADTTWIITRCIYDDKNEASNEAIVSVRNHRRTGTYAKNIKLRKQGKYFVEKVGDVVQLDNGIREGGYE